MSAQTEVDYAIVRECWPMLNGALHDVGDYATVVPDELADRVRRLTSVYDAVCPLVAPGMEASSKLVETVFPQLYVALDDMIDCAPNAPKTLLVKCKKLLPSWAPNSFEQKQLGKSK
jgi:hypothetical protein